ncbi:MAG: Ldh family oxidoreductase [Candidatus Methylomirabilota bacterium]
MTDIICSPGALQRFAAGLTEAAGADRDVAEEMGRHLVNANLSGHDSHGVIRLPQYFAQIGEGVILPAARPEILRETPVTALIDARRGLGQFSTAFALDWAVAHARQHGLAAAAIRHSSHIGRLGEYTERAAAAGLVAILTVGVGGPGLGGMLLYGSRQRFFGANPWSIGVPAEGGPPMVFDGSSSAIAEGKVRLARSKGAALPEGAIADGEGKPTTDPEDFYAGGGLLPLGGSVAGHKGYGLAMASMLVGALAMIGDESPGLWVSSRAEVQDARGRAGGVFLLALDPGRFGDRATYAGMVAEVLSAAKRAPCAPGVPEILIPGEPEVRMRERRSREGIAVPEATWKELAALAARLEVALPERG